MPDQEIVQKAFQITRDPTNFSWITYAWVMLLSIWGGFVSYLRKVRLGISSRFNFTELVGELVTSGLAGLSTFYLCEYYNIDRLIGAVLIAISGHMGSRAIFMIEEMLTKSVSPRRGI